MSNISFSNHDLLAKALDTNKDGFLNELQVSEDLKNRVDSNADGKISIKELASAMKSDMVEVNNGMIKESRGLNVNISGLETLKNINKLASNSIDYVFNTSYSHLEGAERERALIQSNREYALAISKMDNALRTIRDISSGNRDNISRSVNTIARNTLSDVRFNQMLDFVNTIVLNNSGNSVYDDPFSNGGNNISALEARNQNLRLSYELLNSALRNIRDNTSNLPDIQNTSKAVDLSISNAFSNIKEIESSPQSPQEVKEKLYKLSQEQMNQIKGRALPYAGWGAGVGAVAGGTIGYLTGKTAKSILIGTGMGTAIAGGIGALIGHSKDKSYEKKGNELKKLGDEVANYKTDNHKKVLENATLNTYNELLNARNKNDVDSAIPINNNLKNIYSTVKPIEEQTSRILKGYRMK
ncbi:MAG: hypothetical protein KatS3mg068_2377 [Candidatus Sericytochromatia bacterium]|nr:MAG: hypothetical protein KatS3mg068_2377 [Candidatus Sericytochromatia bacterium]